MYFDQVSDRGLYLSTNKVEFLEYLRPVLKPLLEKLATTTAEESPTKMDKESQRVVQPPKQRSRKGTKSYKGNEAMSKRELHGLFQGSQSEPIEVETSLQQTISDLKLVI